MGLGKGEMTADLLPHHFRTIDISGITPAPTFEARNPREARQVCHGHWPSTGKSGGATINPKWKHGMVLLYVLGPPLCIFGVPALRGRCSPQNLDMFRNR